MIVIIEAKIPVKASRLRIFAQYECFTVSEEKLMKRKLIKSIAAVSALFLSFAFAACTDETEKDGSSSQSAPTSTEQTPADDDDGWTKFY